MSDDRITVTIPMERYKDYEKAVKQSPIDIDSLIEALEAIHGAMSISTLHHAQRMMTDAIKDLKAIKNDD